MVALMSAATTATTTHGHPLCQLRDIGIMAVLPTVKTCMLLRGRDVCCGLDRDCECLHVRDLDVITLVDVLQLFRVPHLEVHLVAARSAQSDEMFAGIDRSDVGDGRHLASDRASRFGAVSRCRSD